MQIVYSQTLIQLPDPDLKSKVSLEEVLASRRSRRQYSEASLSIREISQLLWAAQGITSQNGKKTSPSAGATYPLIVFLQVNRSRDIAPGVYEYIPESHSLRFYLKGDFGDALVNAALGQSMLKTASVNILLSADYSRTTGRYGKRGEMYVHMELGHAGQNIYLQAESLGLGTVAVGAFDEDEVQKLLKLKYPVKYIFPVGKLPDG